MKKPDRERSRFSTSLKLTAVAVAVAMIAMCYRSPRAELLQSTLASWTWARPPAPPRSLPPSRADLLSEELARVSSAFEQALSDDGADGEARRRWEALSTQLDKVERENLAEFAEVERHLVEQDLPAVLLDRHRAAVRVFEEEIGELRGSISALQTAGSMAERLRLADEARKLLASKRRGLSHRPVDLQRLPARAVAPKSLPPALDIDGLRRRLASLEQDVSDTSGGKASTAGAKEAAPTSADLAPTEDVQLTEPVRELAESLGKDPVRIFNWVHDHVRFVPTYGSVQGSELTLINKQGNAFDTASLLISLLRASNIPARYVYGTVQVPAERVKKWVGDVPNVDVAQELMGSGGIPNVALVQGGAITHLRLEHVWVEAWLDFDPSRGAVHKQGDTWVPLDASFKEHQRQRPLEVNKLVSVSLSEMFTNIYAAAQKDAEGGLIQVFPGYAREKGLEQAGEALRQLQEKLPNLNEEQLVGTTRIVRRAAPVLDATLPYDVLARVRSSSALSPGLRYAATLRLYPTQLDRAMETPDVQVRVSLPKLNSRRLSVMYLPASEADAELIQSYVASGAKSLPVYLVRLVPHVQLDGVTLASGSATTMGTSQSWELTLSGPNDPGAPDVYDIEAGSVSVFGIDGNGLNREVVQARYDAVNELSVAENMHQVALRYFHQHDYFDDLTARTRNVFQLRLPSAGRFAAPLQVRYLFGLPRWGSFPGRLMDVKRVLHAVSAESPEARFAYMSQVGMQGSFLEGSVLDQVTQRLPGTASSTAQVLLDAAGEQVPIYSLNATNVGALLPQISLSADARAEVAAAVQAGKIVVLPKYAPRGVMGYLIQDPETGAGAYLIDGGFSGGIGEDCEEEPEPEPVRVPSLSPIHLLFLVLAILAAIALWLTPGGQPAGAAVSVVVFAIVFSMVLAPSNAYAGQPRVCCIPKPVPHRGGDPVHDLCADTVPPNIHPGMDSKVDGKNFDALSEPKMLWEAKTYNFDNCRSEFCLEVLQPQMLAHDRIQLSTFRESARKCEYPFALAAGDARYVAAMAGLFDDVVVSPVCLQPTR